MGRSYRQGFPFAREALLFYAQKEDKVVGVATFGPAPVILAA